MSTQTFYLFNKAPDVVKIEPIKECYEYVDQGKLAEKKVIIPITRRCIFGNDSN